jgi:hypothetical protein
MIDLFAIASTSKSLIGEQSKTRLKQHSVSSHSEKPHKQARNPLMEWLPPIASVTRAGQPVRDLLRISERRRDRPPDKTQVIRDCEPIYPQC